MVTQTKTTNCTAAYTWYTRARQINSFVRRRSFKRRHGSQSSTKFLHLRKIVSIEIDYPGSGNKSEFFANSQGFCSKIVETTNGSVTSTKQFVWSDAQCREERNGAGALSKTFFNRGLLIGSTPYFYAKDQLGSVLELTDNAGVLQSRQTYNSFGEAFVSQSGVDLDFTYAGMYRHSRSNLIAAIYRFYNPSLGRFINRDPVEERGGTNLYGYVTNDPINFSDPAGLYPAHGVIGCQCETFILSQDTIDNHIAPRHGPGRPVGNTGLRGTFVDLVWDAATFQQMLETILCAPRGSDHVIRYTANNGNEVFVGNGSITALTNSGATRRIRIGILWGPQGRFLGTTYLTTIAAREIAPHTFSIRSVYPGPPNPVPIP